MDLKKLSCIAIGLICIVSATIWIHGRQAVQNNPSVDTMQVQRILYIDSYNQNFKWSAGIFRGIHEVIDQYDHVELERFEMDSKIQVSEPAKKAMAKQALEKIKQWKPDVVIASDDNASKYLVAPHLNHTDLPVVFCGINWDASIYDFPSENVTGVLEIKPIEQILNLLKPHADGNRVAYLKGDDYSTRRDADELDKQYNLKLDRRFVHTFEEWIEQYHLLQHEADIILVGNSSSIDGWDQEQATRIIENETVVPTGNYNEWLTQNALLTITSSAKEQGVRAARMAMEILQGKPASNIPVSRSNQSDVYLNMYLTEKLGIQWDQALIARAKQIRPQKKKLFYINSYHKGYKWSDDIEKGLLNALSISRHPAGGLDFSQSTVELNVFRLNSKLQRDEDILADAAHEIWQQIEAWDPDCIILSDDNAVRLVGVPYLMKSDYPFVYCGVNRDASAYGLPSGNNTGMIEVAPYDKTMELLKQHAKGTRFGIISVDSLTNIKEKKILQPQFNLPDERFRLVSTFDEWKQEYIKMQDELDMLICLSPIGLKGWNPEEAIPFIMENTKIPTGSVGDNNAAFTMLGRVHIAEEQGWWAGNTALQIINGTAPCEIPQTTNSQSRLYINVPLAKKLGITFPVELLEEATLINH